MKTSSHHTHTQTGYRRVGGGKGISMKKGKGKEGKGMERGETEKGEKMNCKL